MHKCNQCGTEFEGKFCPECGTRFPEEKFCPVCGTTLAANTKFCPECGHSFSESAAAQASPTEAQSRPTGAHERKEVFADGSVLKKAYGVLTFVPAILSAIFSVLLFLCFLGDVASATVFGLTESTGSLYRELGCDKLGLLPTLATLTAFAGLSLIVSVLFLKTTFTADRAKRKKIGKYDVLLTTIYAYISFALFFVHFLIGCIAAGQIADLSLKTEVCIILVIVFSLIFGLSSAGVFVAKFMIGKTHPAWREEENAKLNALSAISNSNVKESENAYAGGPDSEKQMNAIRDVKAVVRRKTAISTFFVSVCVPIAGLIGMFAALVQKIWEWKPENVMKDRKWLIGFAIPCALFCVGYIVLMALTLNGTIFSSYDSLLMSTLIPAFFGISAIQTFAGALLALVTLPAVTRLQTAFYGKKNPSPLLDQPILTMQELYLTEEHRKNSEIKIKKTGIDRFLVSVVCLITCAIIVIGSCIAGIVLGNKFQASKVAKIELGDTKSEVESVLGKADEEKNSVWTYYSNNYMKLAKEAENYNNEMGKAILSGDVETIAKLEEKAEELKKKIKELTYQYISVSFDHEGKVTAVVFDNNRNESDSPRKNLEYESGKEKILLSANSIPQNSSLSDLKISVKIYYSDGSLKNVYIPSSAFSEVNLGVPGTHTIKWEDEWCSYQTTVKVAENR